MSIFTDSVYVYLGVNGERFDQLTVVHLTDKLSITADIGQTVG